MSTLTERLRTVTITSHEHDDPHAFSYATSDEAEHQFKVWLRDSIRFARNGVQWYRITFRGRTYMVLGADDGRRMVTERHRGEHRVWTNDEVREAARYGR